MTTTTPSSRQDERLKHKGKEKDAKKKKSKTTKISDSAHAVKKVPATAKKPVHGASSVKKPPGKSSAHKKTHAPSRSKHQMGHSLGESVHEGNELLEHLLELSDIEGDEFLDLDETSGDLDESFLNLEDNVDDFDSSSVQDESADDMNVFASDTFDVERVTGFVEENSELTDEPFGDCRCGRLSPGRPCKIQERQTKTGKEVCPTGKYPFAAAILHSAFPGFICSGSLINSQWVLTSASCFASIRNIRASDYTIGIGGYRLTHKGATTDRHISKAAQIWIHPGFESNRNLNDIALIRLKVSVDFRGRSNIRPVCLPNSVRSTQPKPGTSLSIIGWGMFGTRNGSGARRRILRQVSTSLTEDDICRDFSPFYRRRFVPGQMMCLVSERAERACAGDEGGPALSGFGAPDDPLTLEGIVSWGSLSVRSCPNTPTIVTNIANFLPDIEEVAVDGTYCRR